MRINDIKSYLGGIFDILVIVDLIIIIISLDIPGIHLIDYAGYVRGFDLTICALLLIEFFYGLFKSDRKFEYSKEHFLDFIASIPFDLLPIPTFLNVTRFLRLIRVVRVFRAVNIVKKYDLEKLIRRTGVDKILLIIGIFVLIFTFLLWLSGINIFESFYFVIITLTTVGYGDDIISNNPLAKLISVLLIIAGVLVFSTITGVMSSYFTDRLLEEGISIDENLHFINQKLNFHERELEKTRKELAGVKEELAKSNDYNEELKQQLSGLKDLIKENH